MSAHRCLMPWNCPIGRPNCSRTFAYSAAVCSAQAATPHASAARTTEARSRTVAVSTARIRAPGTRAPRAVISAVGRVGSALSWTRLPSPAVSVSTATHTVPVADSAARRSRSASPPDRTGGATPSRTSPSDTVTAVSVPVPRATAPMRSPDARDAARPAAPAWRSTSEAAALAAKGPGSAARPASSRTTARSTRSPPPPPYSSGRWRPSSPCPASPSQWAGRPAGATAGASSSLRTSSGGTARASQPRTASDSSSCSCVIAMPMRRTVEHVPI